MRLVYSDVQKCLQRLTLTHNTIHINHITLFIIMTLKAGIFGIIKEIRMTFLYIDYYKLMSVCTTMNSTTVVIILFMYMWTVSEKCELDLHVGNCTNRVHKTYIYYLHVSIAIFDYISWIYKEISFNMMLL